MHDIFGKLALAFISQTTKVCRYFVFFDCKNMNNLEQKKKKKEETCDEGKRSTEPAIELPTAWRNTAIDLENFCYSDCKISFLWKVKQWNSILLEKEEERGGNGKLESGG